MARARDLRPGGVRPGPPQRSEAIMMRDEAWQNLDGIMARLREAVKARDMPLVKYRLDILNEFVRAIERDEV